MFQNQIQRVLIRKCQHPFSFLYYPKRLFVLSVLRLLYDTFCIGGESTPTVFAHRAVIATFSAVPACAF